ncbi:MAG: flagellar export protein FliJ [Nitrospirae bacterium]|nr:flagellar export protein FliJ [Nitrospirota bacterium]
MARYQSKLNGILLHLKFQEELAETALAEKNRQLAVEEEKLSVLRDLMDQTNRNLLAKKGEGILPFELELYQRFIQQQKDKVEQQELAVQKLLEEYELFREKLALAVKEKKVVQKLEKNRLQTYLTRIEKKDQQTMDEIAGQTKRTRR